MKKEIFDKIIPFVFQYEGGYSNVPDDKGGETKYGISKKAYPKLDIQTLTKEQAIEIYYKDYWLKIATYPLTRQATAALFDTAVNLGVTASLKLLDKTVEVLLLRRLAYYFAIVKKDKTQNKFLIGWGNRVFALQKYLEANLQ